MRRCLSLLAVLGLASCGGSTSPATPSYTLAVVQSMQSTTLGTSVSIIVHLTSTDFNGPVALSVTGAPASWVVGIGPSSTVNLVDGGIGTATVTVTIPSTGAVAASGQVLTVHGTASIGDHDATSTVTVANEYILAMALGTGNGTHWGAFNGQTIQLKAGTTFTVRNDDTHNHQVHSSGSVSDYPSQASSMLQGQSYSVAVPAGSYTIYCNVHGSGTGTFTLVVT